MTDATGQLRYATLEPVSWEALRPGDTVWVAGDVGESIKGPFGVYSLGDRSLLTLTGDVVRRDGAQLLKARRD